MKVAVPPTVGVSAGMVMSTAEKKYNQDRREGQITINFMQDFACTQMSKAMTLKTCSNEINGDINEVKRNSWAESPPS